MFFQLEDLEDGRPIILETLPFGWATRNIHSSSGSILNRAKA